MRKGWRWVSFYLNNFYFEKMMTTVNSLTLHKNYDSSSDCRYLRKKNLWGTKSLTSDFKLVSFINTMCTEYSLLQNGIWKELLQLPFHQLSFHGLKFHYCWEDLGLAKKHLLAGSVNSLRSIAMLYTLDPFIITNTWSHPLFMITSSLILRKLKGIYMYGALWN